MRALESNSGMQKADVEDDSKTESLLAESEARAEALRGENVQLQGLLAENEALMAKVSLMRPYPWVRVGLGLGIAVFGCPLDRISVLVQQGPHRTCVGIRGAGLLTAGVRSWQGHLNLNPS